MMEVDRQNGLKMQEEIEKKRREERYLGAMKIMDQIQENEQVSSVYNNIIILLLLKTIGVGFQYNFCLFVFWYSILFRSLSWHFVEL